MFCEHCGCQIADSSKFCDKCGREVIHTGSGLLSWLAGKLHSDKLSKLSYEKKRNLFILAGVIALLGLGFAGFAAYSKNQRALYATIQRQGAQTVQLENQINAVQKQAEATQQQNASTTQSLTAQLGVQKDETDKAAQQAKLAQQALALAKQQSQGTTIKTDNSFPSINTRAIVLIVCFDSSGNVKQSGSGTIVNSEGYVLTNKHVITDDYGNELTCGAFMNDGSASPALQTNTVYSLSTIAPGAGFYTNYDAALLQIDGAINTKTDSSASLPSSFPYIRPQGGNLKQGDTLYIFGYPGASNLVFNVTRGIVSSFTSDGTFINTDAVIDEGNSGGAAITADGRFVGIPTQKYIANSDYLGQILRVENLTVPN